MTQSHLRRLLNTLRDNIVRGDQLHYEIPELWNYFEYTGKATVSSNGSLCVNPYRFLVESIEKEILIGENNAQTSADLNLDTPGGDWIRTSSIYSMHIRTSTSWDHDGSGTLEDVHPNGFRETGTFLKSILLLPAIKRMGFDTIYLLPVSKYSTRYKKGELGSPYAVQDFFQLDPNLKDPLSGEDFSVDDEFAAFAEACHCLGMRVLIDIIPRTSSRDSALILDHPDWFYWIGTGTQDSYGPPAVQELQGHQRPTNETLPVMYQAPDVRAHLATFSCSPDQLAPDIWQQIRNRALEDSTFDWFDAIEREIGVTTAPAFSDFINDSQPPWSDITFLRYYLDHHSAAQAFLSPDQPPYILYDIVKADQYPGNVRNEELWQVIADVIPHYQRTYGIDGARIDMGHALPMELEALIIQKAREQEPDFCLIAEEFSNSQATKVRSSGYNMIVGTLWSSFPCIQQGDLGAEIPNMANLAVPVQACAEMPDTRRAVSQVGGEKFSQLSAVLINFIPNSVPFVSSGFEFYELRPMNTGLGCTPEDRLVLPESDPFYGKLAFFDRYVLHWNHERNRIIPQILQDVSTIRAQFMHVLTQADAFFMLDTDEHPSLLGFGYRIASEAGQPEKQLLILANHDFRTSATLPLFQRNGCTSALLGVPTTNR